LEIEAIVTFLQNRDFADKYRFSPAPFNAVLNTAGTCLFTENKKHLENIWKHYSTPLANEAVLVHP
jgi:glutathione peroxidase-family protein